MEPAHTYPQIIYISSDEDSQDDGMLLDQHLERNQTPSQETADEEDLRAPMTPDELMTQYINTHPICCAFYCKRCHQIHKGRRNNGLTLNRSPDMLLRGIVYHKNQNEGNESEPKKRRTVDVRKINATLRLTWPTINSLPRGDYAQDDWKLIKDYAVVFGQWFRQHPEVSHFGMIWWFKLLKDFLFAVELSSKAKWVRKYVQEHLFKRFQSLKPYGDNYSYLLRYIDW